MSELLNIAIQSCINSEIAFSKFITANDVGATGGHQAGFHIHKHSWSLFFDTQGEKGKNKDIFIKIKWQNNFETDSRCVYYGVGTRNEYRLTRFGRRFPFLNDDNIGDLLVIAKKEDKFYDAYVLSKDEDIDGFFSEFGISSTETNRILPKEVVNTEKRLLALFQEFIRTLTVDFPSTIELATNARNMFLAANSLSEKIVKEKPDIELIKWISTEFELFKALENDRYSHLVETPFLTVEALIKAANTILNRRKSRAGKSLEHHLAKIFNIWELSYTAQAMTEAKKKPDFIFPDIETYFQEPKGSEKLVFLGAKTTCKDRWRQIIGEADRIPQKHLFTLQQGISSFQLTEMKDSGVTLVVPKPYLSSFPLQNRKDIWTLDQFVRHISQLQS